MYDILVVDDDLFALALLEEKLKDYGDFFTPIYASNGKDAVEILSHEEIALLVTDLIMPGDINGWHLIEYIETFHPHIPIVVITGCTDEEKIEQLRNRVREILLKPVRVNQLVTFIINILNEDITSGSLKGISVGSFLQLLEMDEKTCLIEVGDSPDNRGLLYINHGKIYDAEYGDLRETEAACHLVALDNVSFRIKALPKIEIRRRIKLELMTIIRKAMKLKESAAKGSPDIIYTTGKRKRLQSVHNADSQSLIEQPYTIQKQKAKVVISGKEKTYTLSLPKGAINIKKLDDILNNLRGIKGYRAAALMNFTGEILVQDSVDSKIDLESIGPVFNDVLRNAEEAAGKTDLGVCDEFVLRTPDGVIVMSCSGMEATVHFHLIAVLERDGNQALTKIQLARIIPLVMKELEG